MESLGCQVPQVKQRQVHPPPLTSGYPGQAQSCPFVNVLHIHAVGVCCMPVHAYGHSDKCWTAIVMDFNVYLAALPTGGWHRLLAGCNCKVWEAWNKQQCPVTEAQNHAKGRGGEIVTGVHGSVMGI